MVLNQFRAIERKTVGEINKEPSLTVPNQSLSVRDILQRYTMGTMIPEMSRSVYYDGLEDFDQSDETLKPDFDLSDATRISQEVANRLAEAQAEANQKKVKPLIKEGERSQSAERSGADGDRNPI